MIVDLLTEIFSEAEEEIKLPESVEQVAIAILTAVYIFWTGAKFAHKMLNWFVDQAVKDIDLVKVVQDAIALKESILSLWTRWTEQIG